MRVAEVWPEGTIIEIGSYHFTEEKIIEFATKFDPQYFHTDPVRARDSVLGGLCASGWHICSAWMQINVAYIFGHLTELAKQGHAVPKMGPALGFRDLRWKEPVFAGDTISYTNTIVKTAPMGHRTDRLVNDFLCEGKNQHGRPVISFIPSVIEFI